MMKKIDLYLFALSIAFVIIAIINCNQNGDFIFYLLIAILFFVRSIKELISNEIFIILGISASIFTILYIALGQCLNKLY